MLRLSTDRAAASAELVALGAEAVAPLIAELLDEASPVDWGDAGSVLRTIGRPAFAPLAEAIATAPTDETRRRCGWAFVGFSEELLDDYIAALSHPSAYVREDAALGIQYRGEKGMPAAPALLTLLDDPDEDVRQRAVWAFAELGEAALPHLRRVRAQGPGRRRAAALRALAEAGGFEALSPADQAAIERLIRVKLTDEPIEGETPCGPWLALPTGDQTAVLEALDLSSPRPATMRLGQAAAESATHRSGSRRRTVAFVSPRLDGWTLVFGPWSQRWEKEPDAVRELSARFGQAQAYWYDAQTGDSGWTVAERGEIIRHYSEYEPVVGERLPVEQTMLLPNEIYDVPAEEWERDQPEVCDALVVAAALSVSPAALGPSTDVRGHGVLALTRAGREFGLPTGALPI